MDELRVFCVLLQCAPWLQMSSSRNLGTTANDFNNNTSNKRKSLIQHNFPKSKIISIISLNSTKAVLENTQLIAHLLQNDHIGLTTIATQEKYEKEEGTT